MLYSYAERNETPFPSNVHFSLAILWKFRIVSGNVFRKIYNNKHMMFRQIHNNSNNINNKNNITLRYILLINGALYFACYQFKQTYQICGFGSWFIIQLIETNITHRRHVEMLLHDPLIYYMLNTAQIFNIVDDV